MLRDKLDDSYYDAEQQYKISVGFSVKNGIAKPEKIFYIDVEVGVNEYAGFNRCEWTCDATKYMGKLFKTCDTSAGEKYTVQMCIRDR